MSYKNALKWMVATLILWGTVVPNASAFSAQSASKRPKPSTDTGKLTITLRSQPTPPRSGENQFEIKVKDLAGKAIGDADVSLEFYMPAMPSMNIPEIGNTVKLPPAGNGLYRANGTVGMAGQWDVKVIVMRGGQRLGTKHMKLTAR